MYVLVAIKRNKNHCYQFNSLNNPVVNARGRHCSSMNEAHVKSPVLLTLFSLGKWSLKMRLFESNRQIDPSVRRCRKWITYFSSPGEGQQPDPTPSPCFPLFFFFSLSRFIFSFNLLIHGSAFVSLHREGSQTSLYNRPTHKQADCLPSMAPWVTARATEPGRHRHAISMLGLHHCCSTLAFNLCSLLCSG